MVVEKQERMGGSEWFWVGDIMVMVVYVGFDFGDWFIDWRVGSGEKGWWPWSWMVANEEAAVSVSFFFLS